MTDKIVDFVGGLKVTIKSQKINLLVYKEISGKVIVHANKRTRKRKGVKVSLHNTYFIQLPPPDPTSAVPKEIENDITTQNARRTVLRQTSINSSLPITGVHTKARITINGETKEFITTKGVVP